MSHPDDDYVDLPPERAGLPRLAIALGLIVVLLASVVVGARSWYQRQVDPPGDGGAPVTVVVPSGATVNDLGPLLSDRGVIGSSLVFRVWVRGKDVEPQAGRYRFRKGSSFDQVVRVLARGAQAQEVRRVTIPEGLTIVELVTRITEAVPQFEADAVRAAVTSREPPSTVAPPDQTSREGLLFPSTYDLAGTETPATLVARMTREMEAQLAEAGADAGVRGEDTPELSPYEVLVVASLIEEETGNPGESAKIARVIYNRLELGEPLGIDATSRYLSQVSGDPVDFESDSPYNTRRQVGLPPTPIAAPSRASIDAALNPAVGPWTYYVLQDPDNHLFTDDADEFARAKDECERKGLGCG